MLVLTRRPGERVKLTCRGVEIWLEVVVVSHQGTPWTPRSKVGLGFTAPREVVIVREEVARRAEGERVLGR